MPETYRALEEVEIEREELLELSGSSAEEDYEVDTKSRKSGISQRLLSEWTKSQKVVESPEIFRKKARIRMITSSAKFSLVMEDGLDQAPT